MRPTRLSNWASSGLFTLVLLAVVSCPSLPGGEGRGPGLHRRVPCEGTAWTIDLRIPKQAAEGTALPALFLSSPVGSPDVGRWSDWAEANGYVIIGLNDSRNGILGSEVELIQRAAIDTAEKAVKLHPWMRLSAGFSGGAWCSMRMAQTAGKAHAGVLAMGHHLNTFNSAMILAPIPVYFIYGVEDAPAVSGMEQARTNLTKLGFITWFQSLPGVAHEEPSLEIQQAALSVMIRTIKVTNPLLADAERKSGWERVIADVASLEAVADVARRLKLANEMLLLPGFEKSYPVEYRQLVHVWLDASVATGQALVGPAASFLNLDAVARNPLIARVEPARLKPLRDALALLRKEPTVRAEITAAAIYADLEKPIEKIKGSASRLKSVIAKLRELQAAYPDTQAGRDAEARIKVLAP